MGRAVSTYAEIRPLRRQSLDLAVEGLSLPDGSRQGFESTLASSPPISRLMSNAETTHPNDLLCILSAIARSESPRSRPTRLEVDPLEFAPSRLGCLVGDGIERLRQSEARSQRIGHELQDVGELLLEGGATSTDPNRQMAESGEERQRKCDQSEERPDDQPEQRTHGNRAGERHHDELRWTHRYIGDVERIGKASSTATPVDHVVGEGGHSLANRGARTSFLSLSIDSKLSAAQPYVGHP